ncbi:MAG: membrane dipeptidase [Ruminococcaceae bacterium]|nr:membrane dipeptidase [Oscillospiraceae bacterium]
MLICDLHCDLPSRVADGVKIKSNNAHWAEDKLKEGNTYVQVFASFIDKLSFDNPFERADFLIRSFLDEIKNTNISVVTKYFQLEENIKRGINSAILSIEGGEALLGRLENLEYFYNFGIRFLTLTWNNRNQLGSSSASSEENLPLSEFGKAVIKEMNRLKMTPDVSHLSEKGFWDVSQLSTMPFCATHSNSKALCNHKRNLTDEQFCAIKKANGLVGIAFVPEFLEENSEKANVISIVKHIEHFMALGGEDAICLGGDLDGTDKLPCGIENVGDVLKIADELGRINYSDDLIKKIMGENVRNYLKLVL